jgi:hypothetical protein
MADQEQVEREQAQREQESRESDVTKFDELTEEQDGERESAAQRLGEPPPERD